MYFIPHSFSALESILLKVNEIRGNVIEIFFEYIAKHIAKPFEISQQNRVTIVCFTDLS